MIICLISDEARLKGRFVFPQHLYWTWFKTNAFSCLILQLVKMLENEFSLKSMTPIAAWFKFAWYLYKLLTQEI